MNAITPKSMKVIKILVEINFCIAVVVLMLASLLSMTDASIFEFNEDLYGALDNNLRMVMVYLAVTEAVILIYCGFSKRFNFMMLVGFFLILMIGSMQFYGEVNSVAIDPNFPLFFLYTGLSHILFGMIKAIEKNS